MPGYLGASLGSAITTASIHLSQVFHISESKFFVYKRRELCPKSIRTLWSPHSRWLWNDPWAPRSPNRLDVLSIAPGLGTQQYPGARLNMHQIQISGAYSRGCTLGTSHSTVSTPPDLFNLEPRREPWSIFLQSSLDVTGFICLFAFYKSDLENKSLLCVTH